VNVFDVNRAEQRVELWVIYRFSLRPYRHDRHCKMTSYDPPIHHRRSIRLPGYDYTQPGAYFVTLVTAGRVCLSGEVTGGEMRLNRCGEIVCRGWVDMPHHHPHAVLDVFMCMPNHVHGIIMIRDIDGRGGSVPSKIVTPSKARSGELCAPDSAQTRPYQTIGPID
jgi:hypothetical protein